MGAPGVGKSAHKPVPRSHLRVPQSASVAQRGTHPKPAGSSAAQIMSSRPWHLADWGVTLPVVQVSMQKDLAVGLDDSAMHVPPKDDLQRVLVRLRRAFEGTKAVGRTRAGHDVVGGFETREPAAAIGVGHALGAERARPAVAAVLSAAGSSAGTLYTSAGLRQPPTHWPEPAQTGRPSIDLLTMPEQRELERPAVLLDLVAPSDHDGGRTRHGGIAARTRVARSAHCRHRRSRRPRRKMSRKAQGSRLPTALSTSENLLFVPGAGPQLRTTRKIRLVSE